MSVFEAVVLGAVQGLTEFVPISSSGHLVLVPEALGWERPGLAFDVLLHAASLAALVVYFWTELMSLVRGFAKKEAPARRLLLLLAVGTIPAVVAGIVLGDYFEESFEDAPAAAVQLVLTAAILVAAELAGAQRARRAGAKQKPLRDMSRLTVAGAGAIGVAQAVSILPGISRSGATIGAGLALGVERSEAARFAFLLAVPALAGAAAVEVPDLSGTTLGPGAALCGFAASLVTSYAAIWGLIRYLRTNTLFPFAAYCLVAGVAFYLVV